MNKSRFIIVITALVFLASEANSAVVSFNADSGTDSSTQLNNWLTAIGEIPDYNLGFESGFNNGDNISTGASAALIPGGLSFSQGTITMGDGTIGGSNPIDNYAPLFSGNLTLNFSTGINYFSFFEIDYGTGHVVVTLADNTTVPFVRDSTAPSGDSAEFFGIYSDNQLITSILLQGDSTDSSWALDNIAFGITAVPIPASVWLFGSGLLGLVGLARRKKAA